MASIWPSSWSADVFELGEVRAQRMLAVGFHVLEQKLAVAFDGVERRAQVVPQPAVERFERSRPCGDRTIESWMRPFTNAFSCTLAPRMRSRSASRLSGCEPRASSMIMSRKSVTAVAGAWTSWRRNAVKARLRRSSGGLDKAAP